MGMWEERVCKQCQREFSIRDKDEWAYKIRVKDHKRKWFCSYKCLREYKRRKIQNVISGRIMREIGNTAFDSMEMVQTKESSAYKNR